MRRLFLWTFSSVISLVVIVLAIIGASRKSDMQLALVSTNPDGTPCEEICLFGAQPEKMNYAQIQGLLMQHPFLRGLHLESRPNTYDYFFGQTVNVNHVEGLVSIQFHAPTHCTDLYPECYVKPNNVLVQSLRENLRLSSIIKDFGEPDFVELQTGDRGISLISLWYRAEHLEFAYHLAKYGSIDVSDSIMNIVLYSPQAFDAFTRDQPHYRWPGFGIVVPTALQPD